MDKKERAKLGENYRYSNNITISLYTFIGIIFASFIIGVFCFRIIKWF